MGYIYIGSYLKKNDVNNLADSGSGNAVQSTIVQELSRITEKNVTEVLFYPNRSWPRGKFYQRTILCGESIIYPGYINIRYLRYIIFYIKTILIISNNSIKLIIQYNPNFFITFLILILNKITKNRAFYVVFIQDIIDKKSFFNINKYINKLNLYASSLVDLIIPITAKISSDFLLPQNKVFVFPGGVTNHSKKFFNKKNHLIERAVFAGSLESYNGIDNLVSQWINQHINIPLYIFGKGSLSDSISKISKNSTHIIYNGYQDDNVVSDFCANSKYNIILRYSKNINQDYFFPSKLFNLICTNGMVVANKFHGIPEYISSRLTYVDDNLFNLKYILQSAGSHQLINSYIFPEEAFWEYCITEILLRAKSHIK